MRLYLYLARRDKKGARVVTVLEGPETSPVRVTDLKSLRLPPGMDGPVEQIVHENRMYWEPWIEAADSYQDLRASLQRRGYSNLYVSSKPIYDGTTLLNPPDADMSAHPRQKTMVRKGR
jgi:hypothetical protein